MEPSTSAAATRAMAPTSGAKVMRKRANLPASPNRAELSNATMWGERKKNISPNATQKGRKRCLLRPCKGDGEPCKGLVSLPGGRGRHKSRHDEASVFGEAAQV